MQLIHPNGHCNIQFAKSDPNAVPKLPSKAAQKKAAIRRKVEELAILKEQESLCYSL